MKKNIFISGFFFVLVTLTACKVQYAMIDGSIDATTFSVGIFEEQASNAPAGYGTGFSNFLKDFMITRTKLNYTVDRPDLEINGRITQYNTSPVSLQADDQAALSRLTVGINVTVINNKDEKQSFESNFTQFSDYDASQDLASIETALLEDINNKLSQDIINKLTSNW